MARGQPSVGRVKSEMGKKHRDADIEKHTENDSLRPSTHKAQVTSRKGRNVDAADQASHLSAH